MISDYYTQTAKVITITAPGDFSTSAQTESSSTIACAVNPVSGYERFAGGRTDQFADYKLYCSSTISIAETQVVSWDSKRFDIIFVKNTLAKGHHKVVYLSKRVRT